MEVIEIPKNSLPNKNSKIYPEFEVLQAKVKLPLLKTEVEAKYEHHLELRSLIPIIRNNEKYLIPLRRRIYHLENLDYNFNIESEKSKLNAEINSIIEYYKIPENMETIKDEYNPIIIYKIKN